MEGSKIGEEGVTQSKETRNALQASRALQKRNRKEDTSGNLNKKCWENYISLNFHACSKSRQYKPVSSIPRHISEWMGVKPSR